MNKVTVKPVRRVLALWDDYDSVKPAFLERTETKYFRAPYQKVLSSRGLDNRLLDSLVCALPKGSIIAGGFVTAVVAGTTDAGDVDVFFTNEEAFRKAVALMDVGWEKGDDDECWGIGGYTLSETSQKTLETVNSPTWKGVRFLKVHAP